MKKIAVLISMVIFLLLTSWNTILLYDNVVSVDFKVYQYIWSNSGIGSTPVEFAFQSLGYVFPDQDFRIFFTAVNTALLGLICRQYSNGILLLMLTSPFTVLGFGNTVLSFTAGLAWMALIVNSPYLSVVLSILLHKAGGFLSVFTVPLLSFLLVLFLFFGRQFIPNELVSTLVTFEEPLSQIIIKLFICMLPVLAVALKPKLLTLRLLVEISLIFLIVFSAYQISSKVADRIVYMLFFYGLVRGEQIFIQLRMSSVVIVLYILISINILLIFLSGAYEHLPRFT